MDNIFTCELDNETKTKEGKDKKNGCFFWAKNQMKILRKKTK